MTIKTLIRSDKFFVLSDQVMVSAGAFLSNLLLARALGIEEYGRFAGVGLVQLFALSLFMATGTQVYQVVYPALAEQRKKNYTNGLFYYLCILIVIVCLIIGSILILPLQWLER